MRASPLVLVVEDNPLCLLLMSEALSCAGSAVLSADTAEAALSLLDDRAAEVGVVVADVDLGSPGLTGFDVTRHARRLNPGVPVIYATGRSAKEAADLGVDGAVYLAKPYCPVRLCRLVASLTAASGFEAGAMAASVG